MASEDRLPRLLTKARGLPAVPGVYLMKDGAGVVVYIGKAGRLPDRVASYFVPSAELGPRKSQMLEVVEDFEILECETEWEALLVESRLIKDTHPRFNTRLIDDKTFPYLAVTMREDFPRVLVTRQPSSEMLRGATILGPFVTAGALRQAIQLLQRVFKYRTCKLDIVEGDPRLVHFRPCILYSINQCTAPCAGKIQKEAYRGDVQRFVSFLQSKRSVMLRSMREQMESASRDLRFEEAANLRDQIRAIEKLSERSTRAEGWQPETEVSLLDPKKATRALAKVLGLDAPVRVIEAIDIAHLMGGETVAAKVCFVDGRPLKAQYRRYRIAAELGTAGAGVAGGGGPARQNDDYASIREVVSRRYREAGQGQELYPDVILIDGGLGQLHAAMEAFQTLDVKPPMVISLAKKEELIYVQEKSEAIRLARTNQALRLCQAIRDEAHRFAQHYHHVLRRKKTLEE